MRPKRAAAITAADLIHQQSGRKNKKQEQQTQSQNSNMALASETATSGAATSEADTATNTASSANSPPNIMRVAEQEPRLYAIITDLPLFKPLKEGWLPAPVLEGLLQRKSFTPTEAVMEPFAVVKTNMLALVRMANFLVRSGVCSDSSRGNGGGMVVDSPSFSSALALAFEADHAINASLAGLLCLLCAARRKDCFPVNARLVLRTFVRESLHPLHVLDLHILCEIDALIAAVKDEKQRLAAQRDGSDRARGDYDACGAGTWRLSRMEALRLIAMTEAVSSRLWQNEGYLDTLAGKYPHRHPCCLVCRLH